MLCPSWCNHNVILFKSSLLRLREATRTRPGTRGRNTKPRSSFRPESWPPRWSSCRCTAGLWTPWPPPLRWARGAGSHVGTLQGFYRTPEDEAVRVTRVHNLNNTSPPSYLIYNNWWLQHTAHDATQKAFIMLFYSSFEGDKSQVTGVIFHLLIIMLATIYH